MVLHQTYSVEDANSRLPLVRSIVRDIVELKLDVLVRQQRLHDLRARYPELDEDSPYAEEVLQMEESLEGDEIRIDDFAAELRQIGAELVDAESGLVEFVSELSGQAIRLSWKPDESEVTFWRSETEMPADRKPLLLTEQEAG
jgi:hypothetical protein